MYTHSWFPSNELKYWKTSFKLFPYSTYIKTTAMESIEPFNLLWEDKEIKFDTPNM